jgi:hypothetical protein
MLKRRAPDDDDDDDPVAPEPEASAEEADEEAAWREMAQRAFPEGYSLVLEHITPPGVFPFGDPRNTEALLSASLEQWKQEVLTLGLLVNRFYAARTVDPSQKRASAYTNCLYSANFARYVNLSASQGQASPSQVWWDPNYLLQSWDALFSQEAIIKTLDTSHLTPPQQRCCLDALRAVLQFASDSNLGPTKFVWGKLLANALQNVTDQAMEAAVGNARSNQHFTLENMKYMCEQSQAAGLEAVEILANMYPEFLTKGEPPSQARAVYDRLVACLDISVTLHEGMGLRGGALHGTLLVSKVEEDLLVSVPHHKTSTGLGAFSDRFPVAFLLRNGSPSRTMFDCFLQWSQIFHPAHPRPGQFPNVDKVVVPPGQHATILITANGKALHSKHLKDSIFEVCGIRGVTANVLRRSQADIFPKSTPSMVTLMLKAMAKPVSSATATAPAWPGAWHACITTPSDENVADTTGKILP